MSERDWQHYTDFVILAEKAVKEWKVKLPGVKASYEISEGCLNKEQKDWVKSDVQL